MKMTKKIKKKRQKRGKKITIKKKKQITEKKNKVIEFLKENAAFIACFIILCFAIPKYVYEKKLLSNNTGITIAEVIEKKPWLGHLRIVYKYRFNGRSLQGSELISSEEYRSIKVGDCIEIEFSLIDEKVVKWNKEKGKFQCP